MRSFQSLPIVSGLRQRGLADRSNDAKKCPAERGGGLQVQEILGANLGVLSTERCERAVGRGRRVA